jgi:phosphoribosylformylglycinamidine synthase
VRNKSEQYEARLSLVEVLPSSSIFFTGMQGSLLPIVVAHGEGRTYWGSDQQLNQASAALRFVTSNGQPASHYPNNPNGSEGGLTAFSSEDGRSTIMMPHAERVFRTIQSSWSPDKSIENSPWMRMYQNARRWLG